jgi:hypothetical protein
MMMEIRRLGKIDTKDIPHRGAIPYAWNVTIDITVDGVSHYNYDCDPNFKPFKTTIDTIHNYVFDHEPTDQEVSNVVNKFLNRLYAEEKLTDVVIKQLVVQVYYFEDIVMWAAKQVSRAHLYDD